MNFQSGIRCIFEGRVQYSKRIGRHNQLIFCQKMSEVGKSKIRVIMLTNRAVAKNGYMGR